MRFVFILGTGRCGSTLVQELMARHPEVGFVSNVDSFLAPLGLKGTMNPIVYRKVPSVIARRDRAYLRHLRYTVGERLHFGPSEAYRLISRRISPIVSEPFRDLTEQDAWPWLAERFQTFFVERARAQRVPVFMHKFTGWPRARFIHAVLPEARFVHVVRDGRSVASSIVQRPWWKGHLGVPGWGLGPLPPGLYEAWERTGRSLVGLAGLEWRILMDAFDESRARIPDERWFEIRYEDLVDDPRGCWESILAFTDLPWTEGFERAFVRQPVVRSRRGAYRAQLSERDVRVLDDLLAGHLRARGYAVTSSTG
jgi:hypothetical protein